MKKEVKIKKDDYIAWLIKNDIVCNHVFRNGKCIYCGMPSEMSPFSQDSMPNRLDGFNLMF